MDLEDKLENNKDLICKYKSPNDYKTTCGDRIVLYESDSRSVMDYILFEWAPIGDTQTVIFKKECLPKNKQGYFHFCYLSRENEILGVSNSFRFVDAEHHRFGVCSNHNDLRTGHNRGGLCLPESMAGFRRSIQNRSSS